MLCATLGHLLGDLSVESPSCEGLVAMYVGKVGGFQGSKV